MKTWGNKGGKHSKHSKKMHIRKGYILQSIFLPETEIHSVKGNEFKLRHQPRDGSLFVYKVNSDLSKPDTELIINEDYYLDGRTIKLNLNKSNMSKITYIAMYTRPTGRKHRYYLNAKNEFFWYSQR